MFCFFGIASSSSCLHQCYNVEMTGGHWFLCSELTDVELTVLLMNTKCLTKIQSWRNINLPVLRLYRLLFFIDLLRHFVGSRLPPDSFKLRELRFQILIIHLFNTNCSFPLDSSWNPRSLLHLFGFPLTLVQFRFGYKLLLVA